MSIVTIYQSFSVSSPALIFATEEEAINFIRNDFQYEIKMSEENGNSSIVSTDITSRGDWARINYEDSEFVEWSLAEITDMRH